MAEVEETLLAPVRAGLQDLSRLLAQAHEAAAVTALRQQFLGRASPLNALGRQLKDLPPATRKATGEAARALREAAEAALQERLVLLQGEEAVRQERAQAADVTLPGRRQLAGAPHPLRLMERRVLDVLGALGFRLAEGPLVEHDWYNFEALNIPSDHPARDMQDTFFVQPDVVLRTHTSNVQIRSMLAQKAPIRVVAPGMVFRHDAVDATHTPVFHQVEGLWVDEQATFQDLKGVLRALLGHLFGPAARPRFRPSYFPFTEPSAEVDVSCVACGGGAAAVQAEEAQARCRVCRGTGWLEVLGAGLVDPAVLAAVGYDPERVQGFAFGLGLERLAMLRYGMEDIRAFYDNDQRFLQQFVPRPGRLLALAR